MNDPGLRFGVVHFLCHFLRIFSRFGFRSAFATAANVDRNLHSTAVGYAQNDLQNGGTVFTPQFVTMAGEGQKLGDIVPQGDGMIDNIALATLDDAGVQGETYYWVGGDELWPQISDKSCWTDGNYEEKFTEVSFDAGQGLWVICNASEGGKIQTAGQILEGVFTYPLVNGGNATGNPFPVGITLGDIVPTGDNALDNVALATLDDAGVQGETYYWVGGDELWPQLPDAACWTDGNYEEKFTDIPFDPGAGLWVICNAAEGCSLVYTSAELKKLYPSAE